MTEGLAEVHPDSLRAIVMLLAAVVGLAAAVLGAINARVQAAKIEEEKPAIYYRAWRWTETGLWVAGGLAAVLFGIPIGLVFFIPALILDWTLFLMSRSPEHFRAEILSAIFSATAVVVFLVFLCVGLLLRLFDKQTGQLSALIEVVEKLAEAVK